MTTENLEQLFKMNKYFTAPISEWNKLATDIFRRSAQQQLELMSNNFAMLADQLKRLSTVKKPEEFLTLQKECINETITVAVENTQKLMNLCMENMEEFGELAHSMSEPMMSAAKSAVNKTMKKTEEQMK